VITVFKAEKTLVFWVGLLVFGYSIAQFCGAVWQTIYWLVIYPRVLPTTVSTALIEADAVYSVIPLIISGVVFAVIGLYMMKKGVKQERPSTQS
jgi:hypothetical protein